MVEVLSFSNNAGLVLGREFGKGRLCGTLTGVRRNGLNNNCFEGFVRNGEEGRSL